MPSPQKLCIIKLGAIGDVVNSLPLVQRLRVGYPGAHISWVIAPLAHQLLAGHSAVDEFLVLDLGQHSKIPGFIRDLRARKFDLVIDLQRILKSGLLTRLSGSPRRLGFDRARCKESSWLFTNDRIPANAAPGVTVAQYLEFADHLGLPQLPPAWDLPFDAWSNPRLAVTLNIGASKPSNLWPKASWARLATSLAEAFGPERIALCGGPGDRATADEILRQAPSGLLDTVGKLSLKESAGLIAASDSFVACDTGPMHIAVAVDTPLVALFGAADPNRTGPFERPGSVIYQPAECSPCRKRHCFVEGHPCMTGISVESVFERVMALHQGGKPN
ncbi:MAG: heptosyltransferase-1 [Planctomycetota bacterium]|jgi:heptosyltransferase-1